MKLTEKTFHEVEDNNLFSYGTFSPENLDAYLKGEVNSSNDAILIKGWCTPSVLFPDQRIGLRLYCQKTRFGTGIDPVLDNGKYHVNISIPLSKVGDKISCTFEVYDEKNDLLQISKEFTIFIEDKMRENFPNVDWRDFSEYHNPIRNCYWFIHVPEDNHPIIVFNESKNNFKAAIEDHDFNSKFRSEFIRHFRQSYTNSLFFQIEMLMDEKLDDMQMIETPYRSHLAQKIQDMEAEDNLWYKYALLSQEITGIRQEFDQMLKGVTTFDV